MTEMNKIKEALIVLLLFVVLFVMKHGGIISNLKSNPDNEPLLNVDSCVVETDSVYVDESYTDYMKDSKGGPIFLWIGKFNDIDGFSNSAKKTFSDGISFWVAPTKDLSSWNIVSLGKAVKSEIYDPRYRTVLSYGPIIYHKGARWFIEVPKGNTIEKVYTSYQPLCLENNVKLTPKATIAAKELLSFIKALGIITEKEGYFYAEDGHKLSVEEVLRAKDYGIIKKVVVKKGFISLFDTHRCIVPSDYNAAIRKGRELWKNRTK